MKVISLKKYKDDCYSALSRDLTEFEKNFLYIAAGLLAFSTTFIKDIIKPAETVFLLLLFMAWAFIIASIAVMMCTFLKSANTSDELWKKVDDFQLENNLFIDDAELADEKFIEMKSRIDPIRLNCKRVLRHMRQCAVILFIIGITLFASFVALNLNKQQEKKSISTIKITVP